MGPGGAQDGAGRAIGARPRLAEVAGEALGAMQKGPFLAKAALSAAALVPEHADQPAP
jgi:hypothetical protein